MSDVTKQSTKPHIFVVKMPPALHQAVETAARKELITAAAWARRTLLEQVREAGVEPAL